ncbi:MAG: hypothetical protein EBX62_03030, partial [Betaproteobacteria bacterium]|nr:hypothetical protein [Betaproteobacteria bacterium]
DVDPHVLKSLQAAFPTPADSAARALGKYVQLLEQMLYESSLRVQPAVQRKLGLFDISLHDLANRGGQIGPKKVRVHAWLKAKGLSLVEAVVPGSKFTGKISQVKLSKWVSLKASAVIPATADRFLHKRKPSAPNVVAYDFLRHANDWLGNDGAPAKLQYDDLRDDPLAMEHAVPIDETSLQAYIYWLDHSATKMSASERETARLQAEHVLATAQRYGGLYPQRPKRSFFGRTYYEGVSVQNVNRELRRAMLGDCVEYDIRSAVIAFKLSMADECLEAIGETIGTDKVFPWTWYYAYYKNDFVLDVAREVFWDDRHEIPKDMQLALTKQAMTALGFGARLTESGWRDHTGQWTNPALVTILKRATWRKKFFNFYIVKRFILEQKVLDDYMMHVVKQAFPEVLKRPELMTESGRVSRPKVMALLYQRAETQAMDVLRKTASQLGRTPLASVHDAVYFRQRLGLDNLEAIQLAMQSQTRNPHWRLGQTVLEGYRFPKPAPPKVDPSEAIWSVDPSKVRDFPWA